jgi:hypothetical protein
MTEYMLLLRGGSGPGMDGEEVSAAEMQAYLAPYRAWLDDLTRSGKLVHANRLLAGGARQLRADNGRVVVLDGPYTESKDIVGGYYLVRAEGDEDALTIASRCPHLANGGAVELRRVGD